MIAIKKKQEKHQKDEASNQSMVITHWIKRAIWLLSCLNRFNLVAKIILLNWMVYATKKHKCPYQKAIWTCINLLQTILTSILSSFIKMYTYMYIIPPTSSRNEFNFLPFIPLPKKNIETGIACSSKQVSKRASEWVRLWLKSQCRFSMETGDTDALLIQFSKIVFSLETRKTTRNIDADADKFAIWE